MRCVPLLSCILLLAAVPLAAEDGFDGTSHAEGETWPLGFKLPDAVTEGWKRADRIRKSEKADVMVWAPTDVERLRALFLIPNNTDSKHIGEHGAVREVCARHGIAVVYLRHFGGKVIERSDPPETADAKFAAVLDLVARATGRPEARHVPWITLGKSSRGRFPFRTTWWFPDRVVASISYHGEVPSWPMADWSKVEDESVLHLAINGLTEWDGTWYRHVRPGLLNYHHHTGWLGHQMVLYGVGHGNYIDMHGGPGWGEKVPGKHVSCKRVWSYIAAFIDEAMRARVPEDADATEGPIELMAVDRDAGWLIHPRAPEELLGLKWFAFRGGGDEDYRVIKWPDEKTPVYDEEQGVVPPAELMRPAAEVPEDERADYMWVPSRALAERWLGFHDLYGLKDRVLPE